MLVNRKLRHNIGARYYERTVCLCNTKYESLRNEIDRENAIEEIVQDLNLLELAVKEVKLKIKTIRTGNAAELAKVIKSEKKWCRPTRHLCAEIVSVPTSTFIPAWRL